LQGVATKDSRQNAEVSEGIDGQRI
jgi:hypothetical protein